MNNRIDQNTMTVLIALLAQTINSATTTVGKIIDTQNAEDKNFALAIDAYTSDDLTVQITESDADDMTGETVVPAANVNGNEYNFVLAAPAALKTYSYHLRRTMTKRFVRLQVVSADTPVYDVHATSINGSLVESEVTDKNPALQT